MKNCLLFIIFILCLECASAYAAGEENIRLNQIGFYCYGPKLAAVVSAQSWRFAIKSLDLTTTYLSGDLQRAQTWPASGETVAIADFSEFTGRGTYVLDVPGAGTSYPFIVNTSVHNDLMRGLIRAFYYQRASTSLPATYAGKWSRNAGHPDTRVIIHASAASDTSLPGARRTGETYPSPKGWYDAGDYGKYVVNAGISAYTLMALYEQFQGFFDTVSLNIPRPINELPDLLSEIKWEIDWLLTMQDPSDGGVYHKLTSLTFCGFIMPENDDAPRYFIGKGSAATFDFAAVLAVAYRIYKKALPQFADSCLAAAKYAWRWGSAHPKVAFRNPTDVVTGEYGNDTSALGDEQQWAATELFLATDDSAYLTVARKINIGVSVPTWQTVAALGAYSLAFVNKDSASIAQIIAEADRQATYVDGSPYKTVMYDQFYWGSNGVCANAGMLFVEAFLATRNPVYFNRAVQALDYLAGRNALGYCFVTGFGSRSPLHPHHRVSSADGVADPVPGLLAGGPNLQQNDATDCGIVYPSKAPAKSWVDMECAYACNEVAINWNAPAAFLAGALEAIYADSSNHVQTYRHDTPPAIDSVGLIGLFADRVTVQWRTDRAVSASVTLGTDSLLTGAQTLFSDNTTLHSVTVTGLSPATRYYFQVSGTDDFGLTARSPVQAFTTLESGLFQGFAITPSKFSAVPGIDLTITFMGKAGLSAALRYAPGGDARQKYVPCAENNGAYQAIIPGASITSSGVLFSIALSNGTDSIITPVWGLAPSGRVQCAETLSYAKTYYLMSVPLFNPTLPSSEFFGPQLGEGANWLYYGYARDSGEYVAGDSVRTGRGGWLYIRSKNTLIVKGTALKPDTMFSLPLSRGWNLIGSPFTFPVYWENTLIRYNGTLLRLFDNASRQLIRRQLFHYSDTTHNQMNDGCYYSNGDMLRTADTARLLPWQGYWVYAEKSNVELLINPQAAAPRPPGLKKTPTAGSEWRARFSARVNNTVDNAAMVGASAAASDGDDDLDSPKPPLVSNTVAVGLLPRGPSGKGMYAADIISAAPGRSHQWRMAVTTNQYNASVALSWQNTGTIDGSLTLSDPVTGTTIDLCQTASYEFTFAKNETRREFSLRLAPYSGGMARAVPAVWALSQTSPNPFKASAKIRYSVPVTKSGEIRGYAVFIAVYDMLGRRVRTLVNETKYPGSYAITWNGADDHNKRLLQGMYIVRLSASGFAGSVKTYVLD